METKSNFLGVDNKAFEEETIEGKKKPCIGGETVLSEVKPQQPRPTTTADELKDTGYAWLVLAVMFLSNVVTAGYIKSFGVIYNAVEIAYPDTSATAGGVVVALLSGCRNGLAPVVGAAAVQFGARPVMIFGIVLCSGGLFASFFCNSVATLAITLGAMMGTGMCAVETCQIVVMPEYFRNKKELANSIRVAGYPLGGAAFPFFLLPFFEYFGLKLTFIILSALFAQLAVFVFLIRPFSTHVKMAEVKKSRKEKASKSISNGAVAMDDSKLSQEKPIKAKKFDLKLFLNPIYLTHIGMIVGFSAALPHAQYFVAVYGKAIGFSLEQNSILLAYQAVLDSFTRLLLGYMLDKKIFKKTHCFVVCLVVAGIGTAMIPASTNFWVVMFTFSIFSLGSSGYFANINVILIDQFGEHNVASSWGFIRMIQGILNFLYPPLLGYLVDVTGSYYLTFLTMGIGLTCAGLSIASQPLVARAAKIDMIFY
ncbi:monocarboxylate transporter 1 isoform X2 [Hyalella azteca]|uniref:Monocarboxylate transporter 1 isoform X2 n=1 Tax=Hyalella azteca TaxID=294128 RepID=A0A979FL29_HYAAZ|nr:monocarboxylate transporter 1 isoform X2 [Hyalella azteca]